MGAFKLGTVAALCYFLLAGALLRVLYAYKVAAHLTLLSGLNQNLINHMFCFPERWLSKNCEPWKCKNRLVLRKKEVWIQEKMRGCTYLTVCL